MSRITIICSKKEKEKIIRSFFNSSVCPFINKTSLRCGMNDCENCICENIEFKICEDK